MGKSLFVLLLASALVSCGKTKVLDNPVSPISQEESNLIFDIFETVSVLVDSIYNKTEITKTRTRKMNHRIDSCQSDLAAFTTFGEMQNYFIVKHLESRPAQVQFLSAYYDIPSDINDIYPTSLISHEMCPATKESLTASLGESRVPDTATITMLNNFSTINNQLRSAYLKNPTYSNKLAVSQHWAKLAKCLSYVESYSSADSTNSKKVAAQYAPSDYTKPDGVAFYIDPAQSEDSKLNVGTYQFDPDITGNVRACARQWNNMFPSCNIDLDTDDDEMLRILGSELQTFNIFCGINKIHQSFSIQVNSTNTKRTNIANVESSKLKSSDQRCVSINFYSSYTYNHFGPFQNSTGSNLKELISCYFE